MSQPPGVPDRTGARDECGVFAIYAPGEDVARYCYYGLYALQHRGQESAGIAVSDGDNILITKEMGLVNQVFDNRRLATLNGHLAIGHVRYSTTGASTWSNAQPAFKVSASGRGIALGHNGNLVDIGPLALELGARGARCTTDSELLTTLLAERAGAGSGPLDDIIVDACRRISGAYCLAIMDETTIYGVRDPHGVRPLMLGVLDGGGYVLASETAALDIVGATLLREIEPGELVAIDADGIRSRRFASAAPSFCVFEYVYLARPDHRTPETSVYAARRRMGQLLAEESPADADLVIPVPDSGLAAAAGFSQASGIPYAEGLVKNRYVGRTFIQPSQSLRQLGIRLKLNPLRDVLEGQRLVVVDDSIVRGNTSRQLVRMLREAGATQVHLRIPSPPVRHPCFYGVDMATEEELLASGRSIDEICRSLEADSLAYLSLDALISASRRPADSLCRACFDGRYPIPVPHAAPTDTHTTLPVLELAAHG
ncbi:MAG: amidophosphoribosyltransferase [Actinobacteria bacterium]|nr:amidophosphoribosyltransferase [Actinomycetota bacterium]